MRADEVAQVPVLRLLSLGAGVQSTTMALMAAHGEIEPMPDAAIFADTQWEPRKVYEHLKWLMSSNVLPFPVRVVTKGSLRDDIVTKATAGKEAGRFAAVPFFIKNQDGTAGGLGRRQCTQVYKVYPLRDEAKRLYYEKTGADQKKRIPPGSIESWIGISTDEAHRMKPADVKYITNRWPLIEKSMSRWDCLRWLEKHDYPSPPKSSCLGCPYHSDEAWRVIKRDDDEWRDTVEVDRKIREGGTLRGMRGYQYMHRSLVPLDEVDLRSHDERGQPDLFGNECEGMCGV